MPLLTPDQQHLAQAVSELVYTNPFLPERMELERRALGDAAVDEDAVWSAWNDDGSERRNVQILARRCRELANHLRLALASGAAHTPTDLRLYEDLVVYLLYEDCRVPLFEAVTAALNGRSSPSAAACWKPFREAFDHYLRFPASLRINLPSGHRPEHVFSCVFQIARAFANIYRYIVGASMPAARLRAAVWQSIFTHDLRRYYETLYKRMGDFTTLVTGESGTGKELVARAIGRSRYVPFDPNKGEFAEDFAVSFFAVNLSALSPTLIESELFGHAKGSFTGAFADREGWLETCPPLGTVFLDEIGELDPLIQVKLLRVLQARTFSRLGETKSRHFHGKIIAATNRDLAVEMREGRFRKDFYYRLCSDMVRTPALREQLADCPEDLHPMLVHICRGLVDDDADKLADQVHEWITRHLGANYPWPGNFRELEQCVRNVAIRKSYTPVRLDTPDAPGEAASAAMPPPTSNGATSGTGNGGEMRPTERLVAAMRDGQISADELLTRYCTLVYSRLGSYEAAARRLGLDRRTVKAKVDEDLLSRLRGSAE